MNNQESDTLYEKYKHFSPSSRQREFTICCKNGDLEAVKFFLTSPKLDRNVNIHYDKDVAFRSACTFGHYNIVKYFILECGIEKTYEIEVYLKAQSQFENSIPVPVKSCVNETIELFEKRKLYGTLNQELPHGEEKARKHKI